MRDTSVPVQRQLTGPVFLRINIQRTVAIDDVFVNRAVKMGKMTPEEALIDPRRNALVQCIGVTGEIAPEIRLGNLENDVTYMVCSDGFRHVLTEKELFDELSADNTSTKKQMHSKMRELIEIDKNREENDNITVALFRAEL